MEITYLTDDEVRMRIYKLEERLALVRSLPSECVLEQQINIYKFLIGEEIEDC